MLLQNMKDDSQILVLNPLIALKIIVREFPGGLVVRILGCHCRGPGSVPDGELRSHKMCGMAEKIKLLWLWINVLFSYICQYSLC